MIRLRSAFVALMAMTLMVAVAPPLAIPTEAAMSAPGIAIGKKVPLAMALKDSSARPTTLARHMGTKGMVLILFRSADWCPFCKAQLIGLNDVRADLAKQGYALVSLSYDAPEKLTGFAQTRNISFPMLSDTGSRMIDTLRLRDPQYKGMDRIDGVPYPTTLVLSKDGTVRAKHVSTDYRVRQTNADLRAMVASIAG
jgi:peroxiredoxin